MDAILHMMYGALLRWAQSSVWKGCANMLSRNDYIRMSLDLNLFFLRIMKEHSFFLEAAFTQKKPCLAQNAGYFSMQFGALLTEAIALANGMLGEEALNSGQYYTPFTLDAEQVSQYYTGIPVDSSITRRALELQPGAVSGGNPGLEEKVSVLNRQAMASVTALASFKRKLLADVLSCKLFMNTYPLLIDHILREAVFFNGLLLKLQNRTDIRTEKDLVDQEIFWNQIMAEHSKFIRGLLDPTEETLFETANLFGHEFDALAAQARQAQDNPALVPKVTAESLAETQKVKEFNAAGTGGLLQCKVKAIILPLLGDHVLRESNHFIYILQKGARR
jgi:hypothetical protein